MSSADCDDEEGDNVISNEHSEAVPPPREGNAICNVCFFKETKALDEALSRRQCMTSLDDSTTDVMRRGEDWNIYEQVTGVQLSHVYMHCLFIHTVQTKLMSAKSEECPSKKASDMTSANVPLS